FDMLLPNQTAHYNHYHLVGRFDMRYFDQSLSMTRFYREGLMDSTFTSYFYGGQKYMEGHYRLDERVGPWKEYYRNGQVKAAYTYRSDVLEGAYTLYNEDGSLQEVEPMVDGREEGAEYNYGDEGKGAFIYFYHQGNLVGYSYLGKDERPVPMIPLPNGSGKVTAYYANGQKSVELTLVDKVTQGPRSFWFSNGS